MSNIFTEPVDFNQQALLLFAKQYLDNKLYRNYCDTKGVNPKSVHQWQQIPAMPTEGFKLDEPLIAFAKSKITGYFQSSGTTRSVKGKHYHRSLDVYRKSIWQGWCHTGLDQEMSTIKAAVFLTVNAKQDPHSSLIGMFTTLAEKQGFSQVCFLDDLEIASYRKVIEFIKQQNTPIAIFGPALAYHQLQQALGDDDLALNQGSWALETGGYKGQSNDYQREDLLRFIQESLAIPQSHIINEYGMCELSSPAYDIGLTGQHQLPPWCKVQVWNWAEKRACKIGEQGYLKLYDLANQDSVLAIATQDWAICGNGNQSFELIGREAKAVAKGCSLRV